MFISEIPEEGLKPVEFAVAAVAVLVFIILVTYLAAEFLIPAPR